MLPVVQRELQVAARNPRLRAWRLRAGVLVLLVSAGMVIAAEGGQGQWRGAAIFDRLCSLTLLLCLVEGIRKTSDCVSEEKRQGTLGLLFLTDLRGFDIILGKFVSALIRSASALLSIVPILAITLLLGGTTGGEFWRVVLVLAGTLILSLCLCLLVSTLSRDKSLGAAIVTLLVFCIWPFPTAFFFEGPARNWIYSASPFYLRNGASDLAYSREPGPYWAGVAWLALAAIIALTIASFAVRRSWQDRPFTRIPRKRLADKSAPLAQKRRAMLDRNPVMWLMFNPVSYRRFLLFAWLLGVTAVASVLFAELLAPRLSLTLNNDLYLAFATLGAIALALASFLHTARESSLNLAEAKENGALELMLSTPLQIKQIIAGQWLALKAALVPALAFFALLMAYLVVGTAASSGGPTPAGGALILKMGAEVIIGVITIYWVGMWMALTSKSPVRAFLKTIGLGIVFPYLFCTPTLVNQLILLVIAADKVQVHFRRYVADRYLQQSGFTLPPVQPSTATRPPVLR